MKPRYRAIHLTCDQLKQLLEYSLSLPTGQTIGKRWKCNRFAHYRDREPDWWMGEYSHKFMENGREMIKINWYKILIKGTTP
jgi:hypothetical protein